MMGAVKSISLSWQAPFERSALLKKSQRFLSLLILCLLIFGSVSAEFKRPLSLLSEDVLRQHPGFIALYDTELGDVAYFPALEEYELVALGCAYFAPMIVFEEGKPLLMLHAITAFREARFGLEAIEFTFTDEDRIWYLDVHDASADGFFADEGFIIVDEALLEPLLIIADNTSEDFHVSFWGAGDEPLHFALTQNQKDTILLYIEQYIGEPNRHI
jgi:hypothetical protein